MLGRDVSSHYLHLGEHGGRIVRSTLTALSAAACAGLLFPVLSGCGGPGSVSGPPRSSPAVTPTLPAQPSGAASDQEQGRRAYLAMWAAYVAASRTDAYQSPSLARYAAGVALSVVTHGLLADLGFGPNFEIRARSSIYSPSTQTCRPCCSGI